MSEHAPAPAPKTPTDFDELYPGRFLKGGLLKVPVTLTIATVTTDILQTEKGKEEKPIIGFVEEAKCWIPSKTDGLVMRAIFGRNPQAWKGKRVVLWHDKGVRFGRDIVGGIRVKGSPDITDAIDVPVKLPRKTEFTVHVEATGKAAPRPPTVDPKARWIEACAAMNYGADDAKGWAVQILDKSWDEAWTKDDVQKLSAARLAAGGKA